MDDEPKELTESPGSRLRNNPWAFEQIEGQKYVFWDKVNRKEIESPPQHDFVPMPDCPWKLASAIEEYGDEQTLWHEIKTFIQDHVFLHDERLYDVLTAWVKATWILERWQVIPYLLIKGPMSCGKTRLLETLEAISFRGIRSANMSCSALFRALEQYTPTLFLDEIEIYRRDEYSDVLHLLNAGYRRGEKAWRVEHSKEGMMRLRSYDVFGMKAMAGTQELIGTLQSRSIIIIMVKNIKRINFRVNEKRAQALRNRLLLWRFRQISTLRDDFDENDDSDGTYQKLAVLEDGRLMELFECLLKVSNEGLESILNYAQVMKGDREQEEQTTLQYQCLEAMTKCQDDITENKILVKVIRDKMNEGLDDREKFTTHFVTKILSQLGFKKTHMRNGTGILWNDKMLEYRLNQYKISFVPVKSSKSSKSSPTNQKLDLGVPFFEHCYFCQHPIMTDDWVADEFTANKPAHKECYEKQKAMVKV